MKKLLLGFAVMISTSSFANTPNFLECAFQGQSIAFISARVDANISETHQRLEVKVEHSNEEVDTFYPRISRTELMNSVYSNSIVLIADNTSSNLNQGSLKRLVLDVNGDVGTLLGLREGERGIRADVLKLRDALSCKWAR